MKSNARLLPAVLALAVAMGACQNGASSPPPLSTGHAPTFSALADAAVTTVMNTWYAGNSNFRPCPGCAGAVNFDWGADSMIDILYERWLVAQDPLVTATFPAIVAGEPGDTLGGFSDVPMWDAVAALRAYDVTHDPAALTNARNHYRSLVTSTHYALDPCRPIDYQVHDGGGGGLKTLETDSNRILAAVLLSQRTSDSAEAQADLADAQTMYAAVRTMFLDAQLPLYTVYVFGSGGTCAQNPSRQFFASVNGRMIEAGLALAAATHQQHYADEAHATAGAIALLADDRAIFTDLQAQNDIVTPLVLAMVMLARAGDTVAANWITANASAAAHARSTDGSYSRFFDGPPPPADGRLSIYEANGGLALMIAAGALAPDRQPEDDAWSRASSQAVSITTAPSVYAFSGSGIALIGALPAAGSPDCHPLTVGNCEGGHVHLRIDGHEMTDEIGIWQGKALVSSAATILFAWRWPASGPHELEFDPVVFNAKQGGTLIHVTRVLILP